MVKEHEYLTPMVYHVSKTTTLLVTDVLQSTDKGCHIFFMRNFLTFNPKFKCAHAIVIVFYLSFRPRR